MAGDIEAANGLHPITINRQFECLFKEVRRVYPWTRVILVGLTMTGNQQMCTAILRLNALMQHIAIRERLVNFVINHEAKLKDTIHLTESSKMNLCRFVATVIKKPHLDFTQKF